MKNEYSEEFKEAGIDELIKQWEWAIRIKDEFSFGQAMGCLQELGQLPTSTNNWKYCNPRLKKLPDGCDKEWVKKLLMRNAYDKFLPF